MVDSYGKLQEVTGKHSKSQGNHRVPVKLEPFIYFQIILGCQVWFRTWSQVLFRVWFQALFQVRCQCYQDMECFRRLLILPLKFLYKMDNLCAWLNHRLLKSLPHIQRWNARHSIQGHLSNSSNLCLLLAFLILQLNLRRIRLLSPRMPSPHPLRSTTGSP